MRVLVIGGNRYFGKKLVHRLLHRGDQVTVLNRGQLKDDFGTNVTRISCDRKDLPTMKKLLKNQDWDCIVDQICFNSTEALSSIELFQDRTPHYVMASTGSVYTETSVSPFREQDFDPLSLDLNAVGDETQYPIGKRAAEATFFQKWKTPTAALRFWIVLGEDDYTGRLDFHLKHARQQNPVFFPNLNAKISFLNSDDAAKCIEYAITKKLTGSWNCASTEPLSISELLRLIQLETGFKLLTAEDSSSGEPSPFGADSDFVADTTKLSAHGFKLNSIESWLPSLIRSRMKSV